MRTATKGALIAIAAIAALALAASYLFDAVIEVVEAVAEVLSKSVLRALT